MLNLDALPAPLKKAVQHDSYDGGVATDISATSLIDSPRVKRLQREHKDKIQEDATRRIMALLGTTWHSLMEQNAPQGWIVEKRFYATTQRGLVVSGAIDALEPVGDKLNIRDYKVLTSWKAKKLGNLKPDDDEQFIRQLNIYAWLISKNGMTPNKLYVDALIRDWMDGKSKDAGYPDYPVMSYEIPMWSLDETEAHIESQLARHYGEELPRCTDEERLERPSVASGTSAALLIGANNSRRTRMTEGLYAALARAQGEFPPIHKDKTVSVKTRTGGGYSYNYADLSTILKSVTPVLSKNGIAVLQRLQEGKVETILVHSSVEISGGEDPLDFLDDNVPASLDACHTLEDLTQHLSRYQPKDNQAVTAAKQRITNQKEAA